MKLAIVDDEFDCAAEAQKTLSEAGYSVETFQSVTAFKRAIQRDTFDVIFLDWMMPEATGIEVLRWLREGEGDSTPVVMISARADSRDIAEALDRGADDYVVKPFDGTILRARVDALVRRTYEGQRAEAEFSIEGIVLNPTSMAASIDNVPIELTLKEFKLAMMLLKNIGRPLARAYLLETIWGKNREVVTRTLDAHISRVRIKLGLRPENGFVLQTIYGYGYRLESVERCPPEAPLT